MGPQEVTSALYPARPRTASRELDPASSSLFGNSVASTQLRAQVRRVAPYFRSLALTGEPGCGDESVAHSLHQLCPAHDRPFVPLTALEAEERFASDDSEPAREGLIYLPEAERLSRPAQTGLLRLLRAQGPKGTRIVAFVGRGLKPYVSAGYFSAELAGSLASLRIGLPSLRDRSSDIPLLIHYRLQHLRMKQSEQGLAVRPMYLSEAFLEAAVRYAWPENLIQLHRAVDWLMEHRAGQTLTSADLDAALETVSQRPVQRSEAARLIKLDKVVQEHIRGVLLACNGNKLRAAEVLGISRSTLYRMLDAGDIADPMLLAG
jgi:DNA-binding NtrC family response regulator